MRSRLISAVAAVVAGLAAAVAATPATAAPAGTTAPQGGVTAPDSGAAAPDVRRACDDTPHPGRMQCMALIRTADGASASADGTGGPNGYGPGQLQAAYRVAELAKSGGGDKTVAIVDAFDNPRAEADLAVYREQFGLPPCTTDNGCFRKVNQRGDAGPLPPRDVGWGVEIALDLDMVSAVCPRCHILLVEADDNYDYNMAAAVATAAKLGADAISNSYGEAEYPGITALEPFFDQPGVMLTAASGDFGFGTSYPGTSANVVSVGGTSLSPEHSARGWSETAWAGAGSGCSTQIPKPAWQHDPACTHRTSADVAAVADPMTAVVVYDTTGLGGWTPVGGTSAAAPIVAAAFALTGETAHAGPSYLYEHPEKLFDVTSAANGRCSPSYLCTAGPGYDGPTGLGTPNPTGFTDTRTSCLNGWSPTPEQDPSRAIALFEDDSDTDNDDIDVLSASDVWTVGQRVGSFLVAPAGGRGFLPYVEHWDGSAWHFVPSPVPANSRGWVRTSLNAVSFDRPDDGWAVGSQFTSGSGHAYAPRTGVLVQHWDGRRWSLSPALDPTVAVEEPFGSTVPAATVATAVAAISPTDVWVAGTIGYSRSVSGAASATGSFLQHWDGSTWSLVPLPDSPSRIPVLLGLHPLSTGDVWAVGFGLDADHGESPVALHWDGHAWTYTELTVGQETEVVAVSGSSADDVWAVGRTFDPENGWLPFTAHWDGTAWSTVDVPRPGSVFEASLHGVVAISPSDAWAVGVYKTVARGTFSHEYLLEHWDGHEWTIVPAPGPGTPYGLSAVAASSPTNVWATGAEVDQRAGAHFYPFTIRHGCDR